MLGKTVAEALEELKRSIRDSDTLPELPHDPDPIDLARAYADVVLQVTDRQRRIVEVLDAMQHESSMQHRHVAGELAKIMARLKHTPLTPG